MDALVALKKYLDNLEGFRDEEKTEVTDLISALTAAVETTERDKSKAESRADVVEAALAEQTSKVTGLIEGIRAEVDEKLSVEPAPSIDPSEFELAVTAVAALAEDLTEVKSNIVTQNEWRVDFEARVARTPFGSEAISREGEAEEKPLLSDEEVEDLEKNCVLKAEHYWKQICENFEKEYGSYVPRFAPDIRGINPAYIEGLQRMILPGEAAHFVPYEGLPVRG